MGKQTAPFIDLVEETNVTASMRKWLIGDLWCGMMTSARLYRLKANG